MNNAYSFVLLPPLPPPPQTKTITGPTLHRTKKIHQSGTTPTNPAIAATSATALTPTLLPSPSSPPSAPALADGVLAARSVVPDMAREADGLKNVAAETVLPETTVGDGVSVVRGLTLVRMVGVGQVCVVAGAKSAAVVEATAGLWWVGLAWESSFVRGCGEGLWLGCGKRR